MKAATLIRASRKDRKAQFYMPLFILIGSSTGRRKEAILSLRWPNRLEGKPHHFEIESRKRTKKRRGKVPIPDPLIPHLRRAQRRGSDLGPVLHINGKPIASIKKGFAAHAGEHSRRHPPWLAAHGNDLADAEWASVRLPPNISQ